MKLTTAQVQGAFPSAYSRIPKVYREQEDLSFFLTSDGALVCKWDSCSGGEDMFSYSKKTHKWTEDTRFSVSPIFGLCDSK